MPWIYICIYLINIIYVYTLRNSWFLFSVECAFHCAGHRNCTGRTATLPALLGPRRDALQMPRAGVSTGSCVPDIVTKFATALHASRALVFFFRHFLFDFLVFLSRFHSVQCNLRLVDNLKVCKTYPSLANHVLPFSNSPWAYTKSYEKRVTNTTWTTTMN